MRGCPNRFTTLVVIVVFLLAFGPVAGRASEAPLLVRSLNPFAVPTGLPAAVPARLIPEGTGTATLAFSVSNHFTSDLENGSYIFFDGETHRLDTFLRVGLPRRMELAVDIPMIRHTGGFLDAAIDRWHRLLGVSDTGRETVARNQLVYDFIKDGQRRFRIDRNASGIGDIRLSLGVQLPWHSPGRMAAARFGVKLDTGDPDRLTGSGGRDLFVLLSVRDAATLPFKAVTLTGSAGILFNEGDTLLEAFKRSTAAWGHLGLAWQLTEKLTPKIQINWHSPLYRDVGLMQVDGWVAAVVLGGDWKISDSLLFEFGLTEDIAVDTTPDVTLHMALTQRF